MYNKKIASALITVLLIPCMSVTVLANSSWHWLTKKPVTILPWVVIGTLAIETLIICIFNKNKKSPNA